MFNRRRWLMGIERYELRFWLLIQRILVGIEDRAARGGWFVHETLASSRRWAADAIRSRKEELARLARLAPAHDQEAERFNLRLMPSAEG